MRRGLDYVFKVLWLGRESPLFIFVPGFLLRWVLLRCLDSSFLVYPRGKRVEPSLPERDSGHDLKLEWVLDEEFVSIWMTVIRYFSWRNSSLFPSNGGFSRVPFGNRILSLWSSGLLALRKVQNCLLGPSGCRTTLIFLSVVAIFSLSLKLKWSRAIYLKDKYVTLFLVSFYEMPVGRVSQFNPFLKMPLIGEAWYFSSNLYFSRRFSGTAYICVLVHFLSHLHYPILTHTHIYIYIYIYTYTYMHIYITETQI